MKKLPHKRISRRFSHFAAACAVGVMLMMYGITGRAAQVGTVLSDNVNVRTEASANSDRVCKLTKDTQVAIVDQTTGSDGQIWYSITFTHEGTEKSGWIRSDMVDVTETEDPAEGGAEGGSGGAVSAGAYSIQEPVETYPAADALSQTVIPVGEQSFTAWVVDAGLTGGRELYLVWAVDAGGNPGWFYYDPQDGTFQREMGQFSGGGSREPEGMIESLQNELAKSKEENEKSLSQRLYIIIGLAALSVILLILVIVLSVKLRNAEYEYYDDDEEEDEGEDEDEDYEDEPKKKRGGLFRRRSRDEDYEDDTEIEGSDFDDLLVAVKKKWAEEEEREARKMAYEDDEEDYGDEEEYEEEDIYEEDEEEELFSTKELPKIDMSAVMEIEEEAAKEKQKKNSKKKAPQPAIEPDDDDDLDIEILDFEDLGI